MNINNNTSFQDLLTLRAQLTPERTDYTYEDMRGKGKIGGGIGTGASLGSSIGSIFGPIGSLIGAGIGTIAGGITGGIQKFNATKRADSKNAQNAFLNMQTDNTFSNAYNNIATNQWLNTMRQNSFDFGGPLAGTANYAEYNAGGTHETNPLGGILAGFGANGLPNKVEEGEAKYKDYVFSNRLQPSKEFQKHYKLKGTESFADVFKAYMKKASETKNDPITKKGMDRFARALAMEQEKVKAEQQQLEQQQLAQQQAEQQQATQQQELEQQALVQQMAELEEGYANSNSPSQVPTDEMFAFGGSLYSSDYPIFNSYAGGGKVWSNIKNILGKMGSSDNDFDPINDGNLLSYSTLLPQAVSLVDSLVAKPDYSAADQIAQARRGLNYSTPEILSDRMDYTPVDSNRYLSSLRSNNATVKSHLRNIAGPNKLAATASLLGSNRDMVASLGELMPAIESINEQRKNQALQFNSGINARNAAARMQTDAQNRAVDQARYNSVLQEVATREAEDKLNATQRNAALTNWIDTIRGLGSELSDAERLKYLLENTDMYGNMKNKSVTSSPLNIDVSSNNPNLLEVSNTDYMFNPGEASILSSISSKEGRTPANLIPRDRLIPKGPYEDIEYSQEKTSIPSKMVIDTDSFNKVKDYFPTETISNIGNAPTTQTVKTTPVVTTTPTISNSKPPQIIQPKQPAQVAQTPQTKTTVPIVPTLQYPQLTFEPSANNTPYKQSIWPPILQPETAVPTVQTTQTAPPVYSWVDPTVFKRGSVSEQLGFPSTLNYMEKALQLPTATSNPAPKTSTTSNKTVTNDGVISEQIGYPGSKTMQKVSQLPAFPSHPVGNRNAKITNINKRMSSLPLMTRFRILAELGLPTDTKIESLSPYYLQRLETVLNRQ